MARGFESKQVESQQAEAERQRDVPAERGPDEDRARLARRRSLELARADVTHRLAAATAAPHREMLKRSLAALDAEIAALGAERPASQ
jgi:hypothetical protein